ncbi:MAG: pyrroline-5-carboxylate reductase [Burkholderiales bacterium]
MNITFVGGGNMATALIGRLIGKGADTRAFRIIEPHAPAQQKLTARFPGIGLFREPTAGAIEGADVVVMAVKPQQMRIAAEALAPFIAPVPVVLTIAAGTRAVDLARWLGGFERIVRAMPNTPALVGAGISGAFAGPAVAAHERALAARIVEAAGAVVWVDREEMLDAVTGVSGSGPAYVFYFLEALEEAARAVGFAPGDARQLAYQTFAGALALAQSTDLDPATLRAQVTSKGGTTERALGVLEDAGVKAAIVAAVRAATERARELGETLGADK